MHRIYRKFQVENFIEDSERENVQVSSTEGSLHIKLWGYWSQNYGVSYIISYGETIMFGTITEILGILLRLKNTKWKCSYQFIVISKQERLRLVNSTEKFTLAPTWKARQATIKDLKNIMTKGVSLTFITSMWISPQNSDRAFPDICNSSLAPKISNCFSKTLAQQVYTDLRRNNFGFVACKFMPSLPTLMKQRSLSLSKYLSGQRKNSRFSRYCHDTKNRMVKIYQQKYRASCRFSPQASSLE